MIKKILLTLGILTFGIINFSFGYYEERGPRFGIGYIGFTFTNVHNSSIDLEIDGNGNFYSTYGLLRENFLTLYFDESQFVNFYWNKSGYVSSYIKNWRRDGPRGGTLEYYYLCDFIEGDFSSFSNCVRFSNTGEDVLSYMGGIQNGDMFIYGQAVEGSTVGVYLIQPFIAFNVSSLNKVVLFTYKTSGGSTTWYGIPTDYSYAGGLINEYNGDYGFLNFPSEIVGESPAFGGGGSNIPISGDYSSITGGYTYMNCTNQNVLAYYIRTFGYNGSMCNIVSGGVADGYYPYGTLLEFCNIIYIFNNEDLSYYNKPYTGHNKNIVCNSPGAYFTGDEPVSIDWSNEFSGLIDGSGEYENQSSRSFLINLSDILKGNFYIPESGDFGLGYLPRYIILGFMGVIFFNFIRK